MSGRLQSDEEWMASAKRRGIRHYTVGEADYWPPPLAVPRPFGDHCEITGGGPGYPCITGRCRLCGQTWTAAVSPNFGMIVATHERQGCEAHTPSLSIAAL